MEKKNRLQKEKKRKGKLHAPTKQQQGIIPEAPAHISTWRATVAAEKVLKVTKARGVISGKLIFCTVRFHPEEKNEMDLMCYVQKKKKWTAGHMANSSREHVVTYLLAI